MTMSVITCCRKIYRNVVGAYYYTSPWRSNAAEPTGRDNDSTSTPTAKLIVEYSDSVKIAESVCSQARTACHRRRQICFSLSLRDLASLHLASSFSGAVYVKKRRRIFHEVSNFQRRISVEPWLNQEQTSLLLTVTLQA